MPKKKNKCSKAFRALLEITPGGVNSPFRSFHEVGGETLMVSRAQGAYVWDLDGKKFVDYLGAWGPAILGHAHPAVVAAACAAVKGSAVFGLSTAHELEMARLVQKAFPSMEMIRFVNSGAEAVECAIRLARGFTRKSKIVRFEGGYHGHGDSVLWTYGPEENLDSKICGVPEGLCRQTLTAAFNDPENLARVFEDHPDEIAALLVEPVAGSMGVIPPDEGFLQFCRDLAHRHGALLIFDEVLTGFRVAFGGAQERYRVEADITCLGKIMGGGLPAGAYGGKKEIMRVLAPLGPVYQAGTFSGNPVTMSAGIAAMKILSGKKNYSMLEKHTRKLMNGFQKIARESEISLQTPHVGSMFAVIFCDRPIRNYRDNLRINKNLYSKFFHAMIEKGILFPPSATDAAVVSMAHSEQDLNRALAAFRNFAATGGGK